MRQSHVGLNQAARLTGKNKSVIWRDTNAGKLSSTQDGKGKTVYNIAELERVYGRLQDPTKTVEALAVVETEREAPSIEAERLALKLEFLERELSLVKDQMSEIKQDRDHWRSQAETVLRALPAPAQASEQPERRGFWPFRRRESA